MPLLLEVVLQPDVAAHGASAPPEAEKLAAAVPDVGGAGDAEDDVVERQGSIPSRGGPSSLRPRRGGDAAGPAAIIIGSRRGITSVGVRLLGEGPRGNPMVAAPEEERKGIGGGKH